MRGIFAAMEGAACERAVIRRESPAPGAAGSSRLRRVACLAIGLSLAAILAASSTCSAPGPQRPPSLLLISVDTLRADHVHSYGYERRTTPTLDALAAAGVRFAQAWSHSPWTLPSHATMLSGTHPFRHGVVDDGTVVRPSLPLLAQLLRERGYRTMAAVSGFYVSSRFGFDRGFESFEDFGLPEGARPRDGVRAEEVTARIAEEIARAGDEPFFAFAHYFDAHTNYDPPPPWNRAFDEETSVIRYVDFEHHRRHPLPAGALPHIVAQYDEEILYTDAMIGRLLEELDGLGRRKDTYIVVTSDHGEEFFEHASWGHGHSLYATVMRVPLIIAGPDAARGRVVERTVGLVDLAPTLLELLALPPLPESDGESFAALVGRRVPSPSAGEVAAGPRPVLQETSRHSQNQVGIVLGALSLIADIAARRTELYDLDADPAQRHSLAASRVEELGLLWRSLYQAILAAAADRWRIAWSGEARGEARIEGWLLGPERPPLDPSGAIPFVALDRWRSGGAEGAGWFASIPPDAPLEFLVDCGRRGPTCASVGEAAVMTSERTSAAPVSAPAAGGRIRFVVDPVADGERLRGERERAPPPPPAGSLFHVSLETRAEPPVPSGLTPEEIEHLRSLGYLR